MRDRPQFVADPPRWSPDARYILGMLPAEDHFDPFAPLLVDAEDSNEPVELYRQPSGHLWRRTSWKRLAPIDEVSRLAAGATGPVASDPSSVLRLVGVTVPR